MENQSRVPVSIYAEMTPNPAVLKFVANMRLIEDDHVEFRNIEEAKPSPVAVKLFHLPFVKEVFISGNYIAVTKYDIVDWSEVTHEVRELIREFLAGGGKIYLGTKAGDTVNPKLENKLNDHSGRPTGVKSPEEFEEIEKKIASLLEEYVKPAVEQDGGNIQFLELKDGVARVLLQGACSGCPSSTMTLKQGIHNLLNQMLPGEIKDVVAVNG